ncbi:MAG: 1,2-phenylacetyl-CoA epoxidase subunit PaaD [Planctomycetota bacterium]|jgi:ring-1,2-phenylacetyl-CoA epoxidase subunit PaaD
MITTQSVMDVLQTIPDPEMPISIVDLGLVEDVQIEAGDETAHVSVEIVPTIVGCPALEMIANEITSKIGDLAGVGKVDVHFTYDPPWSVDRISAEGRASLRERGVTLPEQGRRLPLEGHVGGAVELRTSAVTCPFCGSDKTTLDSMYGPARRRPIYYCVTCRNSFEDAKKPDG